jgi:hypothetical protein
LSDPNPNCSCFDPESIILESIFDGFQEDLDIDPDDIDYGELVNTVFKVYTSVCWEEVPPSLENPYGVCRLCQGNACCEVEYQVIYKKIHYHDPLGESYEILAVDEVNYIGNQNPLNISCPEPCEYECDNWVIDDEDWDELLDPPMGKKPIFKSEIRFSSIVHPNPTLNNVTIRLNSNPKNRISLKLLDNNGRTVYSKNNFDYNDGSGIVVEFSNFESGVYYYIIESENQIIYTGKIISNK